MPAEVEENVDPVVADLLGKGFVGKLRTSSQRSAAAMNRSVMPSGRETSE